MVKSSKKEDNVFKLRLQTFFNKFFKCFLNIFFSLNYYIYAAGGPMQTKLQTSMLMTVPN